jgi:hypothetical protein
MGQKGSCFSGNLECIIFIALTDENTTVSKTAKKRKKSK